MEIEAQSEEGDINEDDLHQQCTELMGEFDISPGDLVSDSYSDLLMRKQNENHIRGH